MIGQHLFQPQWYEIRNQLQEENQKKNVEINNVQWITEEIKGEIKKYLDTNENRSIIYQNLWNAAKGFTTFISLKRNKNIDVIQKKISR